LVIHKQIVSWELLQAADKFWSRDSVVFSHELLCISDHQSSIGYSKRIADKCRSRLFVATFDRREEALNVVFYCRVAAEAPIAATFGAGSPRCLLQSQWNITLAIGAAP